VPLCEEPLDSLLVVLAELLPEPEPPPEVIVSEVWLSHSRSEALAQRCTLLEAAVWDVEPLSDAELDQDELNSTRSNWLVVLELLPVFKSDVLPYVLA
jgi:hypothetical protein